MNSRDHLFSGRMDGLRSLAAYHALPHAAVYENQERMIYATGIEYATMNGVIEAGEGSLTEKEVDRIIHFFNERSLPFIWWAEEHNTALEKKGLQYAGKLGGLVADIVKDREPPKAIKGLSIVQADNAKEFESACNLAGEVFCLGEVATRQFLEANKRAKEHGEFIFLNAYMDGKAVSTITVSTGTTTAGLWNLATTPDYCRRGIGKAIVHAAMVEAKRQGYEQMMTMLGPKGSAAKIFHDLGFKSVSDFPFYISGVDAAELGQ